LTQKLVNHVFEILNFGHWKQIPMTKAQNSKLAQTPEHSLSRNVWVIGISDLDIICHLGFEIWDFKLVIRETK